MVGHERNILLICIFRPGQLVDNPVLIKENRKAMKGGISISLSKPGPNLPTFPMVSSCSKAPIWHILKPPWNCGEPKRSATKLRRNWAVLGAGLISRGKGCENPPDLGSFSMYTVCITDSYSMYTMVTIFNQAQLVSGDTARLEFGPQMLTRFDPCRGRKIVLCTFLLFALPVHPVQLQQSFVLICINHICWY